MDWAKFLACQGFPWSSVDHPAHKEFFGKYLPKFHLKSSTTFTRRRLPCLFRQVKAAVEKEITQHLDKAMGAGFTCDHWTSANRDPYIGLTMHLVTNDWKMMRFMVYCGPHYGRHTGELTAQKIDELINALPFEKLKDPNFIKIMTTDSEQAMVNAVKGSQTMDGNIKCVAHQIHTAITKAIDESKSVLAAVNNFKRLVQALHQSVKWEASVKYEVDQLNRSDTPGTDPIKYRDVVQQVSTRWNSTLMLIESVINLRRALVSIRDAPIVAHKEFVKLIPVDADFDLLSQMIPPLKTFAANSEYLCGEAYPTICWAAQKVYFLLTECHLVRRDKKMSTAVMNCFARVHRNLNEVLPMCGLGVEQMEGGHMYSVGNLLNPSLKGNLLLENGLRDDFVAQFLVDEQDDPEPRKDQPSSLSLLDKDFNKQPVEDWETREDALYAQSTMNVLSQAKTISQVTKLSVEMDRYLNSNLADRKIPVLEWWKANEKEYPLLAQAVRKYFGVQPTSSSSERTFSCGGHVATTTRANLDPEKVHMTVYIKENVNKLLGFKLHPTDDEEVKLQKGDKTSTESQDK